MLKFLFALVVTLALAIVPVMYTARAVNARRTSLGWVILAVITAGLLSKLVAAIIPSMLLANLLGVFVCAFGYQIILETSYKNALIISVVSSVVGIVGGLLLAVLLGPHVHSVS